MKVKVRLFATLRKGRELEYVLDLDDKSTGRDVLEKLDIPAREVTMFLVNGRRNTVDKTLVEGDVLSLFPPVGGG